jgi:5-(carboxyamino)imidazole ribonucleotide synthase
VTALAAGSVIGILGGGQLGRMLAIAAARLGYKTVIFDPDPEAPAAQLATRHVIAGYDDRKALADFAAACDVVTYEFENVPVEAASLIAAATPVFPKPNALDAAQDRIAEKEFLNRIGVATAPFRAVERFAELSDALQAFHGAGILKTRRLGYDGKGQAVLNGADARQVAAAFAALGGKALVLEGFVPFAAEISVIAARLRDGGFKAFDPPRNSHESGILARSAVPSGLPAQVEQAAVSVTKSIMDALDYVGVMGAEFFVLEDGTLLVNEIAPRVHNSGHWTEAACLISQFEQHIRAITGLPLGDTARHCDCVMENLIGADVDKAGQLAGEANVLIHLYGKAEPRPGRKMGHFTRIAPKTSITGLGG